MDSLLVALLTVTSFTFGTLLFLNAARGVARARAEDRLHAGWTMDEAGWHAEPLD